MIVVQTIKTSWTKASRGGGLAVARNRVPKKMWLQLPDKKKDIHWHEIQFSEENKFVTPLFEKFGSEAQDNHFGCDNAEIILNEDSVFLNYRYRTGAPTPILLNRSGNYISPEHSISINANQWATIEYNCRLTGLYHGNWWYQHVIVNVAVGESVDENVFLSTKPIEHFKLLFNLR